MYYLLLQNKYGYFILEYPIMPVYPRYTSFDTCGYIYHGTFGRLEYATHWRDLYNNK